VAKLTHESKIVAKLTHESKFVAKLTHENRFVAKLNLKVIKVSAPQLRTTPVTLPTELALTLLHPTFSEQNVFCYNHLASPLIRPVSYDKVLIC